MPIRAYIFGSAHFIAEIEPIISGLSCEVAGASGPSIFKDLLDLAGPSVSVVEETALNALCETDRNFLIDKMSSSGRKFIIVTDGKDKASVNQAKALGAADCINRPYNGREFISRFNAVAFNKFRIVCLGGGTGLFNLLLGLKTISNALITSIVSTSDDGGSSGRLRVDFGMLPPGDIRRSVVALSNAPDIMNRVMQYRFSRGEGLKDHNLGNLLITALTDIIGSFGGAIKELSDLLYVNGIVLPVSSTNTTLCVKLEGGSVVRGERFIDVSEGRDPALKIKSIWHEPVQEVDIDAYAAILNADLVVIGPGDLYTSIITNLVVKGVPEALGLTAAKKVYICNLMTEPGETHGYDVYQHIKDILGHMEGAHLDYIIVSNTDISEKAVRHYAGKGQYPVKIGMSEKLESLTKARIMLADVGHETELVRHDGEKLRAVFLEILRKETGEEFSIVKKSANRAHS
jgi:uncharacterized cofD-like protein